MTRNCHYCERPFDGRANRRYCSDRCKDKVKHHRAAIREAMDRQERYLHAQLEAAEIGDFPEVRRIRNSRIGDMLYIGRLLDRKPFKRDKALRVRIDEFFESLRLAERNGYTLRIEAEMFKWGVAMSQKTLTRSKNLEEIIEQ